MSPKLQRLFPALCLLGVLSLLQCPLVLCEVYCSIPELKNGKITQQRKSDFANSCVYSCGDMVPYTCYKKYKFEARCQADGMWSPETLTCDQNCRMSPNIAHGSHKDVSPLLSFTTVVQYKCDEGYVLVGEAKITCRNSHWSSPAPQCKALCLKPEIENGNLSVDKDLYVEPENVTVQCDSGYAVVGSQSITCSENGSWYPNVPKCEWEVHQGCEQVLEGSKLMQCLSRPEDVKMALEVYKLSLEIKRLKQERDLKRSPN